MGAQTEHKTAGKCLSWLTIRGDQKTLEEIIDGSAKGARYQLTQMTPQLASLIDEVAKWLMQDMEKGGTN